MQWINHGKIVSIILAIGVVSWPAQASAALSAAVAKECQALMVKAHPPQPFTRSNYAAEERAYFKQCVAQHSGDAAKTNGSGDSDTPAQDNSAGRR